MRVGHHELEASKASTRQHAQELRPDRLGLGCTDLHDQHFAPAVGVDADRDNDGDRDDAPAAPNLQVGRVDPQVWPSTFDRPFEEGLHLAVDLLAQARDLAPGNPAHAHGLDQVVDRARRDALDICLLDHRRQRLLGHPAGLQEAREVGALPQLRNAQLDAACPRLPVAVAIAVALRQPRRALLAMAGTGQRSHLDLHQPLGGKGDHLAQPSIGNRLLMKAAQGPGGRVTLPDRHRRRVVLPTSG